MDRNILTAELKELMRQWIRLSKAETKTPEAIAMHKRMAELRAQIIEQMLQHA